VTYRCGNIFIRSGSTFCSFPLFFVCAIVIGYNGVLSDVFGAPLEWIEELSEGIKDFTDIYPAWLIFMVFFAVIFLNNAFTCFLDIILGPLLGVFSTLFSDSQWWLDRLVRAGGGSNCLSCDSTAWDV